MNEIMQEIAKAEGEAAQIKEQARSRAGEIVADAEKEAAAYVKSAEMKAKTIREEGVRAAQMRADGEYAEAVKKSKEDAVAYADARLSKTDMIVNEIVRRITGGR